MWLGNRNSAICAVRCATPARLTIMHGMSHATPCRQVSGEDADEKKVIMYRAMIALVRPPSYFIQFHPRHTAIPRLRRSMNDWAAVSAPW